jgi:hypothetical protein
MDEYKVALEAHTRRGKDFAGILIKDGMKMKQKWYPAKSSELQGQDLITKNHGIRKSLVRRFEGVALTDNRLDTDEGFQGECEKLLQACVAKFQEEAVRWADIEEGLKHGKALYEATERADSACQKPDLRYCDEEKATSIDRLETRKIVCFAFVVP